MNIEYVAIPYGYGKIDLLLNDKKLKGLLELPESVKSNKTEMELVREALKNPIDSKTLADIAMNKKNALIITNDHTRAMRSMITLPMLIDEIRSKNRDINITILIATGLHRATTEEEMIQMFGEDLVKNEKIVVHDAFNDNEISEVGALPSGAVLRVNKLVVESDLLVTEGFIEPHFFAGFSGGRKSILPGVCSYKTVVANHCYKFINDPNARGGELDKNPINMDMIMAARMVDVDFTLNVVLNKEKKIEAAFAGDIIKSHLKGCEYVRNVSKVKKIKGDIVITGNGGYPLDQNLYQSPKAVNTAVACANDDAVIIMCAKCEDGIGGEEFKKLMLMGSPQSIDKYLSKISPEDTIPEQWCAQIYSKILMKHKVILVSEGLDPDIVRKMNFIYAKNIEEAYKMAVEIKGVESELVVIPDGVRVIV